MNRALVIVITVISLAIYQYVKQRELVHPPGILVSVEPVQKDSISEKPIKYKDAVIEPLAEYQIEARVLSTERYWFDKMAKIAPTDLAVGWQEMSNSKIIDQLSIRQADRFYFYSWSGAAPLEPQMIVRTSANMHLIPSTEYINQEIKNLHKGNIVSLRGYLVRVNFPDGSEIKSSLSRTDSGPGACEVMWVQSLNVEK